MVGCLQKIIEQEELGKKISLMLEENGDTSGSLLLTLTFVHTPSRQIHSYIQITF